MEAGEGNGPGDAEAMPMTDTGPMTGGGLVPSAKPAAAGSSAARLSTTGSEPAIAYLDDGGTGEPVIFVHGVGSSSATWRELFGRIGSGYRLIAADLRGHGRSQAVPGPYRLSDFVNDHVRLLDELGLNAVHVVGFSLGALIGQAIALGHPDRTSSLVLLNSVGARTEAERARARERLEVIQTAAPPDVARASVSRWFTEQFARDSPGLVASEVGIVSSVDPASYAAAYEVLATGDLIDEVHAITCPVLVLTGEGDVGSTPRMSAEIHARIAGSRLVIVPVMKHYLHVEAPGTIAGLIAGFLADVRERAAVLEAGGPEAAIHRRATAREA
jgi:pimeloyl-ACP methyl ester carboxylesterase